MFWPSFCFYRVSSLLLSVRRRPILTRWPAIILLVVLFPFFFFLISSFVCFLLRVVLLVFSCFILVFVLVSLLFLFLFLCFSFFFSLFFCCLPLFVCLHHYLIPVFFSCGRILAPVMLLLFCSPSRSDFVIVLSRSCSCYCIIPPMFLFFFLPPFLLQVYPTLSSPCSHPLSYLSAPFFMCLFFVLRLFSNLFLFYFPARTIPTTTPPPPPPSPRAPLRRGRKV